MFQITKLESGYAEAIKDNYDFAIEKDGKDWIVSAFDLNDDNMDTAYINSWTMATRREALEFARTFH